MIYLSKASNYYDNNEHSFFCTDKIVAQEFGIFHIINNINNYIYYHNDSIGMSHIINIYLYIKDKNYEDAINTYNNAGYFGKIIIIEYDCKFSVQVEQQINNFMKLQIFK